METLTNIIQAFAGGLTAIYCCDNYIVVLGKEETTYIYRIFSNR